MSVLSYRAGRLELANGATSWTNDNFYMVLVSSAYTFNNSHETYSQLSGEISAQPDYQVQNVTGKTVGYDSDDILYDCSNVSFGEDVSLDVRDGGFVIVKGSSANPQASDRLMFFGQMSDSAQSTNSQFAVLLTNGVLRIQKAV